tara:strand:+ start:1861 stop:2229 length:369 start_codon:yes stop_codon:yes gene_type:complete
MARPNDRRLTAFGHHLFEITQAEIVGEVPAYAQQDHRSVEMAAFEQGSRRRYREIMIGDRRSVKSLRQIQFGSPLRDSPEGDFNAPLSQQAFYMTQAFTESGVPLVAARVGISRRGLRHDGI